MYLLAGIISARNNWNRRGAVRAAWADASQVPHICTVNVFPYFAMHPSCHSSRFLPRKCSVTLGFRV